MGILCNIPVIKIGNSKIQKYIQQEGKRKNCRILAVAYVSDLTLYLWLNYNRPKRLYKQV